jgi:hypothetical protein
MRIGIDNFCKDVYDCIDEYNHVIEHILSKEKDSGTGTKNSYTHFGLDSSPGSGGDSYHR